MGKMIDLLLISCVIGGPAMAGGADRLLPPASDFRLTLVEDPQSTVPLGASCTGEAELTLTCRAFTLTLENIGKKSVRLSWSCNGPDITLDEKNPNSTSGWWPESQLQRERCAPGTSMNLRLKPGEQKRYTTRLMAPPRFAYFFPPGPHTLRATWTLWGCTDENAAPDCLTPLQIPPRPPSCCSQFELQEPVDVISNEITVTAPQMPDLGSPKFSLEVALRPGPPDKNLTLQIPGGCAGEASGSIDCAVFHYKIRNVGDRPVRDGRSSCPGGIVSPEYSIAGREWKPVPSRVLACTMNVYSETPILPGQALEGNFTLWVLGYDTKELQTPGEYRFRFTFWPHACIASPDASFCLIWPQKEEPIVSADVAVHATAGPSAVR